MRYNPFKAIRGGRGTNDEPPPQINRFGPLVNTDALVGVFPQEPPDPIRQGVETPSRPARWRTVFATGMDPQAVAEGRFLVQLIAPYPHATYPRTRMTPDYPRSNVRVPPHVAYGSLFTSYGSP